MKILNSFWVTLLVAVMGNFFVACSSDDEEESGDEVTAASIIGTWKVSEDDITLQITFNATGEGELRLEQDGDITTEKFYFNY